MRKYGEFGGEIVEQPEVRVEIPGFDDSISFDLRHPHMPQQAMTAVRRCYGLPRVPFSFFFRNRKVLLSKNGPVREISSCILPAHCHFVTQNGLRVVPKGMPELVLFMENREATNTKSWERFFKIPKELRGLMGQLFGSAISWDGAPYRYEDRRRIYYL